MCLMKYLVVAQQTVQQIVEADLRRGGSNGSESNGSESNGSGCDMCPHHFERKTVVSPAEKIVLLAG